MHVFGSLDTSSLQALSAIHADWITLVPFGSQGDYDAAVVRYSRSDSRDYIEARNQRWVDQITLARQQGFKVMVKPHIWMHAPSDGKWRSDIYPSDGDWLQWQTSYRDFIMRWAAVAEEAGAELLCVGTELTRLTAERPAFWRSLIKEVRLVYSGQLTYAANWYEEYEAISFWDDLDYIGVQAYFPLGKDTLPSLDYLKDQWQPHIDALGEVSHRFQKPLLFTEVGYKSTADATARPWEWVDYGSTVAVPVSEETQAIAYQAVFETVWLEPWFAGIHLWQWRTDDRDSGDKRMIDFTPKGKLAMGVIAEGYMH